VMMSVAGIADTSNQTPQMANEAMTRAALNIIAQGEMRYRSDKGNFGSLDQLIASSIIDKNTLEGHGYHIELSLNADGFVVTAVPIDYGKTGKFSYFVDQSQVIRGADHGGGPASASDNPVQ